MDKPLVNAIGKELPKLSKSNLKLSEHLDDVKEALLKNSKKLFTGKQVLRTSVKLVEKSVSGLKNLSSKNSKVDKNIESEDLGVKSLQFSLKKENPSPETPDNDKSPFQQIIKILKEIDTSISVGFEDLIGFSKEDSDRNEQLKEAAASRQRLQSELSSDESDKGQVDVNVKEKKDEGKSLFSMIASFLPKLIPILKGLAGLLTVGLIGSLAGKFFPEMKKKIQEFFSPLTSLISNNIGEFVDKFKEVAKSLMTPLIPLISSSISSIFGNIKTSIKTSITEMMKKLGRLFKVHTFLIKKRLKTNFPKTFEFFKKIGDFFKKIPEAIEKFKTGDTFKSFKKIGDFFRKISEGFSKGVNLAKKPFSIFMKVLKGIFSAIKFVGNLLLPIMKLIPGVGLITNTFGLFKGLFNIIKFVGSVAKKLFLPLTIFMAVWDTIQGAMDGFEEGGIIGAIKGGMSGLFNSLVGGLMDLVKDGVSWILTKFGFDNAAKFLDSFSFQDLYKDFLDLMFSIPGRLYDAILSALKSIPIIGDKIAEMLEPSNKPLNQATKSGLLKKGGFLSKDSVDINKVDKASNDEILSVLSNGDLGEEDRRMLEQELKVREKRMLKKSETSNLEKSKPDNQIKSKEEAVKLEDKIDNEIKLAKEETKSSEKVKDSLKEFKLDEASFKDMDIANENLKEASSNIKDSLETVNKTAKDSKKEIKSESEKSKSVFSGIFDSAKSSLQDVFNLFGEFSPEAKGELKEGAKQIGKGSLNMLKGGMVGFLKMLKKGDIGAGIETMRDSIITTGSDLVKRGDIKDINAQKLSKTDSKNDVNMGDIVTNPINFLSSVIGINEPISKPIPESKQTSISPEQLKQNVSGVQITGLENIKEFMQGSQNQNNVVSTNLNSVNAPSSNVVNTVNYINKDEEWTKKSFYNS